MKIQTIFLALAAVLILNASVLAQETSQNSRGPSEQPYKQSSEVKEGIKGTVYEVIVEKPKEGESDSYWTLKIERNYFPVVFAEGKNEKLVSGSEIEVQKIVDGQITEYIVTKAFEGKRPGYNAESKMGGHILMAPLYKNNIAGQEDLMNSLDWTALAEKSGDFYRDISNNAYDLSIIHVAEAVEHDNTTCSWNDADIDLALLQQGFDVEMYNHVVYLYPPVTCSNGWAFISGNRSATDLFNVAVISHEMGHNLGWGHDNGLPRLSAIEHQYANPLSVMGRGFVGYNPSLWPASHPSSEAVSQASINLEFPMKPSVGKIQQIGWSSINPYSFSETQLPQTFILDALATNGDQPNYVDLSDLNDHLEYRCDVGVDTEAVAAYADYRIGLFYFENNLFIDADLTSIRHYIKPTGLYKNGYKISYTNLPDCKALVNLELAPFKNLEIKYPRINPSQPPDPSWNFTYETFSNGGLDIDEEFVESLYVRQNSSQQPQLVPGQTRSVTGLADGDSLPGSFILTPGEPFCGEYQFKIRTDSSSNVAEIYETDNESYWYVVNLDCGIDYGDAPDHGGEGTGPGNYQTLLSRDGARHIIDPNLYLGSCVDSESGNLQNQEATADDENAGEVLVGVECGDAGDEDGLVYITGMLPGGRSKMEVVVSDLGYLNVWIDFNRDGDWTDEGEHVVADRFYSQGGQYESKFDVPEHAVVGETYMRIRYSYESGLQSTGGANSGEVEDYQVKVEEGGGFHDPVRGRTESWKPVKDLSSKTIKK